MAAANYIGLDEVLEAFQKKAKTPIYSLWRGTNKADEYDGGDIDEAIEQITDTISRQAKRGLTDTFYLILHKHKAKTYSRTDKENILATIDYKAFELPGVEMMPNQTQYNSYSQWQEINALKSEIAALKTAKIDDEDDEDDEDNEDQILGTFNKIAEHPLVVGLINKWLTGSQPIQALAGVETDQSLQETINILFSKGVELQHLQKLAAMDESKIKMLLQML